MAAAKRARMRRFLLNPSSLALRNYGQYGCKIFTSAGTEVQGRALGFGRTKSVF
jgi:hypothetical protein